MNRSTEIRPVATNAKPIELRILNCDSVEFEATAEKDVDPRTIEKPGYLNIGRMLSRESVEKGWVNQYVPSKNQ